MQALTHTQAIISLIETLPTYERNFVLAWFSKADYKAEDSEIYKKIETNNDEFNYWLSANEDAIAGIWDTPEDNVWDTIYKNHEINGRLQTV